MSLESVLCYRIPCRNPSLLLDTSNRNFLSNSSVVAQSSSQTPRILGLSAENLDRTRNVCFLRMIQTTLGQHGLYKACSFKQKGENLQLEDCEDHQRAVESYLNKVESQTEHHNTKTSNSQIDTSDSLSKETSDGRMKTFLSRRRNRKANLSSEPDDEESSNFSIVSTLASIDIAVFLFEVASPVKNSDYNLYSLPLVYGAKVNDLILVGEWWRLVTPMFLHSGVFHVALSSWVLLDFGPRVCKVYGSFTFVFLCLLGGISGNLLSFLHTPEATVGGSGPVFAIIGAWLIYQLQNKDIVSKQVSQKMFQKAVIATTLSFGLANFGLIDSWTYLGAIITGISYGFLTCPILQLDDPLSKVSRDEGIAIARQYSNPYKSLGVFVLFVLVLSSMLYLMDPPLDTPQLEGLLELPHLENLLEMVE